MKKYLMVGLAVSLSLLTACSPLMNEKTSNTKSESSVSQRSEKTVQSLAKINKQKIHDVLVDYQSVHVFEDNMIGNITYNFSDTMSDDDISVIHELLDTYYLPIKKGIVGIQEIAKQELNHLGFDQAALSNFLEADEKLVVKQNEWSTKMVEFTRENAGDLKREIAESQFSYQIDSQMSGQRLLKLLESTGMSENEATELLSSIILEAMEIYGDPQDVEKIKQGKSNG